jgi:hypothetical protein
VRIVGLLEILGLTALLMLLFQSTVLSFGIGIPAYFLGVRPFTKGMIALSSLGNAFMLYVLIGVLVKVILVATRHDQSFGWMVFYATISALLLYGLTSAGLMNKMQPGGAYQEEFDLHGTSLLLKVDATKSLLAIPLFIVALIIPMLVVNPLTEAVFRLVLWIAGIPFLGAILGIVGILFALSFSWSAFLGIGGVVAAIVGAFRRD